MSVSFKEGELVQAGQVLASIDPQPYELQLAQAQGPLMQDQAVLDNARANLLRYQKLASQNVLGEEQVAEQAAAIAKLEARIKADQIEVDRAKLQLIYARVTAPITGVAGLRLVDPGNIVHAADAHRHHYSAPANRGSVYDSGRQLASGACTIEDGSEPAGRSVEPRQLEEARDGPLDCR